MANIRGYSKVETMAEDSFEDLLSAAFTAEGTGIFFDLTLPVVGRAYDASGAMSLPHCAVYCESVKPATPDSREELYECQIEIILRTSIREDSDKNDINLFSAFIRYILAHDSLASELNATSPNPDNNYILRRASSSTADLEFKRMRIDSANESSILKVSGRYYEIAHRTKCLIGVA
jgi:hypothetical protein